MVFYNDSPPPVKYAKIELSVVSCAAHPARQAKLRNSEARLSVFSPINRASHGYSLPRIACFALSLREVQQKRQALLEEKL
jgi:hypothetical protein